MKSIERSLARNRVVKRRPLFDPPQCEVSALTDAYSGGTYSPTRLELGTTSTSRSPPRE